MKKDNIFALKKDPVPTFEFNEEVTSVFDDMIKRSVPLYMESLKRQSQLTSHFYKTGTKIYDLGCSHGNLGLMIHEAFGESPYTMIAVDSSHPMIDKYRKRLKQISKHESEKNHNTKHRDNSEFERADNFEFKHVNNPEKAKNISLVCGLAEEIPISNASVVIVNLTMQFIKPAKRDGFVQGIYDGLIGGGILLLSEKTVHKNDMISWIEQDFYKKFKLENGYSELEISRKRDSLENILISETLESHAERLKKAGFNTMNVWLKWFNFASMIAIK